jgi:hypothetical protein
MHKRSLAGMGLVLVCVGASLVAFGPAASAGVPIEGVVGIHSSGSKYAGTNSALENGAYVAQTPAGGGTAKYAVEILNPSTDARAYAVSVSDFNGVGIPHLLDGKTDVTQDALSGFYTTGVVKPGKAAKLTFTITLPATTRLSEVAEFQINTFAADFSDYTGSVFAVASVKATKGFGLDTFVKAAAGQEVLANSGIPSVSSPTIATNKSANFSIVLRNDTSSPAQIPEQITSYNDCTGPAFVLRAKVGNTDVTSALVGGTYLSPVLAPGKSLTIKVSVTSGLPHPDADFCPNLQQYIVGSGGQGASMFVNAVY